MAFRPDGTRYFVTRNGHILKFDSVGNQVDDYALPPFGSCIPGLAIGANGEMWVSYTPANTTSAAIGHVTGF